MCSVEEVSVDQGSESGKIVGMFQVREKGLEKREEVQNTNIN